MSTEGGRSKRDDALQRVEAAAKAEWRAALKHHLAVIIAKEEPFTSDDVWDAMLAAGFKKPREPRANGPAFMSASKRNKIRKTGFQRQCRYSTRHATLICEWISTTVPITTPILASPMTAIERKAIRAPRKVKVAKTVRVGGRRIYLASSWRNTYQPGVVAALRAEGHAVYDFRDHGFNWRAVDGNWQEWTPDQYIAGMSHPEAEAGFKRDMEALGWCDVLVMVMPCGPSAAAELGWAVGASKPTAVYMPEIREPDLMVKMAQLLTRDLDVVMRWLREL